MQGCPMSITRFWGMIWAARVQKLIDDVSVMCSRKESFEAALGCTVMFFKCGVSKLVWEHPRCRVTAKQRSYKIHKWPCEKMTTVNLQAVGDRTQVPVADWIGLLCCPCRQSSSHVSSKRLLFPKLSAQVFQRSPISTLSFTLQHPNAKACWQKRCQFSLVPDNRLIGLDLSTKIEIPKKPSEVGVREMNSLEENN